MPFFPVDKRMGEKNKWFPMIKVGKKELHRRFDSFTRS
jgi:hypothetical protein